MGFWKNMFETPSVPTATQPKSSAGRGAWIFLSHSQQDWENVRIVRNALEERGHKPLVFFLKCLNDDTAINDLIHREIAARTWFLLCDSENARSSKWVQTEVDMIKSMPGKFHETIHLDEDLASQIVKIDDLCKRATTFISYTRDDNAMAGAVMAVLEANDFCVIETDHFSGSELGWQTIIAKTIDECSTNGFILLLLSPGAVQKEKVFISYEIEYALRKAATSTRGANVLPVFVGDVATTMAGLSSEARKNLSQISYLDLSQYSPSDDFTLIVETLLSMEME